MTDVKQVIVIRKDLNMRKGKIAAQASHAAMAVFVSDAVKTTTPPYVLAKDEMQYAHYWSIPDRPYFEEYITGSFKKIVVSVNSEKELLDIYNRAIDDGITASLIKDAGLTEFGGVPTYTAVGLGPWNSAELDLITGELPLL